MCHFFDAHAVPRKLRSRAMEYVSARRSAINFGFQERPLWEMSPALRRELQAHVNAGVLERVPALREGTLAFLHTMASRLQREVWGQDDVMLTEGDPGAAAPAYFLVAGCVAVRCGSHELGLLCEGDALGEIGPLLGRPRCASAVATAFTEALALSSGALAAALARHPDAREALLRDAQTRLAATNRYKLRRAVRAVCIINALRWARRMPPMEGSPWGAALAPVAAPPACEVGGTAALLRLSLAAANGRPEVERHALSAALAALASDISTMAAALASASVPPAALADRRVGDNGGGEVGMLPGAFAVLAPMRRASVYGPAMPHVHLANGPEAGNSTAPRVSNYGGQMDRDLLNHSAS